MCQSRITLLVKCFVMSPTHSPYQKRNLLVKYIGRKSEGQIISKRKLENILHCLLLALLLCLHLSGKTKNEQKIFKIHKAKCRNWKLTVTTLSPSTEGLIKSCLSGTTTVVSFSSSSCPRSACPCAYRGCRSPFSCWGWRPLVWTWCGCHLLKLLSLVFWYRVSIWNKQVLFGMKMSLAKAISV